MNRAVARAPGGYEPTRSTSPAQLATGYPQQDQGQGGGRYQQQMEHQHQQQQQQPAPKEALGYAWKVAMDAANALGRGFDVTSDFRLGFAKGASGSRLVEIDETNTQDIVAPGNIVIPNVSVDIRCDKGEKTHYASEVLTYAQVLSLTPTFSLLTLTDIDAHAPL